MQINRGKSHRNLNKQRNNILNLRLGETKKYLKTEGKRGKTYEYWG